MGLQIALNSLIDLADQIIIEKKNPEVITKIEEYALNFNDWFDQYQKSIDAGNAINTKQELELLLSKHEAVSAISDKLKAGIPDQMARLQTKAKGIMAYTDTLPKKISFTKTTKG